MKPVRNPIAQIGHRSQEFEGLRPSEGAQREPEGRDDGSLHLSIHFRMAAAIERVFVGGGTYCYVSDRRLAHSFTASSDCLPLLMAWSSFRISSAKGGI